jgi:hypothetical protein
MTTFVYVWSCSARILLTNKSTDETKNLSKAAYSKKMMRHLQEALKKSFSRRDGLAHYMPKEYQKIITSVLCTFDEEKKVLKINVSTTSPLSTTDIQHTEKFISGQLSDGWGEGFEQIPFYETKTMDYQMFSLWKTLKYKTMCKNCFTC